ncbi:MAG: hypothetical protein RPT00_04505 [Gammaproteobacteria bacterium]
MSQLLDFIEEPWKSEKLHKKYTKSFIHLSPLPEVATGEVLLASLYRNVGFNGVVSEKQTPILGRKLTKNLDKRKRPNNAESAIDVDDDLWVQIVTRSITSPKQTNQSKKQFLQLSPLVPDSTIYSMSARLAGNPWNPGRLIAKMISMGSDTKADALTLWQSIFEKLSVTEDDDVWARLIQKELMTWREKEFIGSWSKPEKLPLKEEEIFDNLTLQIPAVKFVKDLKVVLALKNTLTRRQWISMMESLCRIAACSHVMWLCTINKKISEMFEQVLRDGKHFTDEEVRDELSQTDCFWSLDQPTNKTIEETVRGYILGRCALNLILSDISDKDFFDDDEMNLTSPKSITKTLNHLSQQKEYFDYSKYRENLRTILEMEPKITACKKGTSKNILEFISYVVRQRQTSEAGLESYDQGYYLRKRGAYSSAPWIVGLGPTALLLMVHCTAVQSNGPCTIADLIKQLSFYGLEAEIQQDSNSMFYKLLRSLGLVIESPDAEGGMVINSPFKISLSV